MVKILWPFSSAALIIDGFASGTYAITSFIVIVLVFFNSLVKPFPPPLLTWITALSGSMSNSVTILPASFFTILLTSFTLTGIASSILLTKSPTSGSDDFHASLGPRALFELGLDSSLREKD